MTLQRNINVTFKVGFSGELINKGFSGVVELVLAKR